MNCSKRCKCLALCFKLKACAKKFSILNVMHGYGILYFLSCWVEKNAKYICITNSILLLNVSGAESMKLNLEVSNSNYDFSLLF